MAALALDVRATLGEGLLWDVQRQCLWMVDIHGKRLVQWDLKGSTWREWPTDQRIGWVLPCVDGVGLLAGFQEGMARIDPAEPGSLIRATSWLARPFGDRREMRLNDAKADSGGAVWAGSLNNEDESRSDGALFRLGPDGQWSVQDSDYCVANGPALHPQERLLLHTDSARRTIYAFDVDVAAGRLSRKRVWRVFTPEEGYPDGMSFDADGAVWVAHWGGACISRFSLDGELLRRMALPTSHVTNVCFAGPGLDRLFVSTAIQGLSDAQRQAQSLAGGLFEVDAGGVRGLPAHGFGGPGLRLAV